MAKYCSKPFGSLKWMSMNYGRMHMKETHSTLVICPIKIYKVKQCLDCDQVWFDDNWAEQHLDQSPPISVLCQTPSHNKPHASRLMVHQKIPLKRGANMEQRGQEHLLNCRKCRNLLLPKIVGWGGRGGGSSASVKREHGKKRPWSLAQSHETAPADNLQNTYLNL